MMRKVWGEESMVIKGIELDTQSVSANILFTNAINEKNRKNALGQFHLAIGHIENILKRTKDVKSTVHALNIR